MQMTDVGSQIRAARKTANLSQSELGDAIGRTSKTVRRYEQGKTTPDTNVLSLIASATGHPVEYFLTGQGSKPRSRRSVPSPTVPHGRETEGVVLSIPMVTISGTELVKTGDHEDVPALFLRRVGLDTDRARLLHIPGGHYTLRRQMRPSDTLVLDVLQQTQSLDAFIRRGRFVDGRYLVDIGASGLQIKDLTARPDGTVAISGLDDAQRFRCSPENQAGVIIHAIVAMGF